MSAGIVTDDKTYLEALYDCVGVTEEELTFETGDRFILLNDSNPEWWHVRCITVKGEPEGFVPRNYIRIIEKDYQNDEDNYENGEDIRLRGNSTQSRDNGSDQSGSEEQQNDDDEDSEGDEEEEESEEEDEDLRHVLEQRKLQRKQSKKLQLQSRKRLVPPDPLKGFGVVPLGFRLSTLAKNYQSGYGRLSQILAPQLAGHGLSFQDLALDKKNRIRQKEVKCTTAFSIIDARSIPPPGSDLKVVGRHVRLAIFDRANILSNIHIVPAIITRDAEPIWRFSTKASLLFPKDDENTCFFRVNEVDIKLCLLFELCLVVVHPDQENRPTSQPRTAEISCGWGMLPLFTADGGPIENKSYEVKLFGGSPFEKEGFIETGQEKKGFLRGLLDPPKSPRVNIRVWKLGKQALDHLNKLPDVIISHLAAAPILALYRQTLATSLLSVGSRDLKLLPRYDPILSLVPTICDQMDLMRVLVAFWEKKLKTIPSAEKKSFPFLRRHFLMTVLTLWPLLHTFDCSEYVAGDDNTLEARQRAIQQLQELGPSELMGKNPGRMLYKPFDSSEVTFDCLPSDHLISAAI